MDLQQLSKDHLIDAQKLLDVGRWAGAYYLSGYAVECALKACIVKQLQLDASALFEDRKFTEKCYTHDLVKLVETANLKSQLDIEVKVVSPLSQNWAVVKDWNEQARYKPKPEGMARAIYLAISDTTNGVLPWIQKHW